MVEGGITSCMSCTAGQTVCHPHTQITAAGNAGAGTVAGTTAVTVGTVAGSTAGTVAGSAGTGAQAVCHPHTDYGYCCYW